jgi:hypothetical protein
MPVLASSSGMSFNYFPSLSVRFVYYKRFYFKGRIVRLFLPVAVCFRIGA